MGGIFSTDTVDGIYLDEECTVPVPVNTTQELISTACNERDENFLTTEQWLLVGSTVFVKCTLTKSDVVTIIFNDIKTKYIECDGKTIIKCQLPESWTNGNILKVSTPNVYRGFILKHA